MTNLASILERESAVLIDPRWDVEEERAWLEKVDMEGEKEALCLDLDKLTLTPSSASDVPENLALSKLEGLCFCQIYSLMKGRTSRAYPRIYLRSR